MVLFIDSAFDKLITGLKEVITHLMLIIDLLHKFIVIRELLAVLKLQPIQQPFLLSVTRE